ncbi:prephenate dehydrogenase [Echinicola pacifica]|uniref:Prephenate dehydrogenase n=1 Tax=Echinicola pacifica TaxID=346377 RepID=A0A918QBX4_9BACT|nr:prephenate dehydrogenase [Echinicola pacifica]GGZ40837.1 prephenate dehydrogenase [Echinicola pacifica]
MEIKNIHIIGLGLLGGSFALALKKHLPQLKITGHDQNPSHLEEALQRGIIDEHTVTPPLASEVIVISTPVNTVGPLVVEILETIHPEVLLMDFGSTKEKICLQASSHPRRSQFLAAHPIAGTEFSGPSAAFTELLINKIMIVCEHEKTSPDLLKRAYFLFNLLQMHVRNMGPEQHDRHLAFVSHLSHISSFMLGQTVLDKMEDDKNILDMAGSGFESTVRLAKSSPAMWTPILKENKGNILEALDGYIKNLSEFRKMMAEDQYEELNGKMKKANLIGTILEQKK